MLKSIIFFCFAPWLSASIANIYYANASAGSNDGTSCANAYAYSDGTNGFNAAGKWGAGSTQIGADTIAHVCGTITGSNQANGLTFQAGGTSGHPVTLLFESGAVLVAPQWGTAEANHTGAVRMISVSNVTLDLGANGHIYNSLNGTTGGSCPGGTCVEGDSALVVISTCANCIVQNGEIGPVYTRTSTSDRTTSWGGVNIWVDGTNASVTISGVTLHDGVALMWNDLTSSTTSSGFVMSNNNMYNCSAGAVLAQGSSGHGIQTSFTFNNNHVHDFALYNDATNYDHHHDGIHVFSYNTALTGINIYDNTWDGDMGSGTAWIYYEQYSAGTGAMNIFNNLFDFVAVPDPMLGAGGTRTVEFEGNAITASVYNNTIYGLVATGSIASGIYNNGSTLTGDLRNNITGGVLEALLEGALPAASTNNNVWDFAAGSVINVNSLGYNASNFGSWKTACSCDSASSTTAPNLSGAYKIQNTSSSAYQKGQNLTGNPNSNINTDLAGISRPGAGSWDAGAYQFVAPPTGISSGGPITRGGPVVSQ